MGLLKTLFIIAIFLINILPGYAQSFNVATYNLRNENTYDVGNLWKDRYPFVVNLILYHDFELFGTQEVLPGQLADLKRSLPGFEYYGEGRDGNGQGEHAAIFYKTSKYSLKDKGDFWLSETPDIPSKSWDAPCCNRICTWVKLQENISGIEFFVFNTHYDYEKDYARNQSSILVLNKIKEIAGNNPVIFMGDLNGSANDSWCKIISESDILRDTYFDISNPYANDASYNAFGKLTVDSSIAEEKQIIDHIYFSKHFNTEKWGLLTDTYNMGKFPSDHFPVLVKAGWNINE